jgi:hypothetical protein
MPAEALKTVAQYVAQVRTLLEDNFDLPYRYSTADIVNNLNVALQEGYRLRPDLFLSIVSFTVPGYDPATDLAVVVPLDFGYRQAVCNYIVGVCQLRDQEDTADQRAAGLMASLKSTFGGGQ